MAVSADRRPAWRRDQLMIYTGETGYLRRQMLNFSRDNHPGRLNPGSCTKPATEIDTVTARFQT